MEEALSVVLRLNLSNTCKNLIDKGLPSLKTNLNVDIVVYSIHTSIPDASLPPPAANFPHTLVQ